MAGAQAGAEGVPEAERQVGVFGGEGGDALDRGFGEGEAAAAGAGDAVRCSGFVAEVAQGGVLEAVGVGAGAEGVGDEHGVVDRGGADAGAVEDEQAGLAVVDDLEDGGVGQERLKGGEGGVGVELVEGWGRVGVFEGGLGGAGGEAVAERDVAGAVGGGGEADAEEVGAVGVAAVGLQVEAEDAGGGGFGDPGLEGVERGDGDVGAEGGLFGGGFELGGLGGGRGGVGEEAEPGRGAAEAHGDEPAGEDRVVGLAGDEAVERLGEGAVAGEFDELTADADLVDVLGQDVAALAGLHGGDRGDDAFDIAVLGDELGGVLGADAGDAGDVVDAVAHEGLDLGDLVGGDAEFGEDFVGADRLLLDGVEHADAVVDQLHQVLVGGDDGSAEAGFGGLGGVGGDEVVGFPVGQFDGGDAEGGGGVSDEGELGFELVGGLGAVGLVVAVEFVAERGAAGVEDDGDVGALVLLEQAGEHVGEAEDGVDGGAVGPGHGREGVEGAEDEAGAVDEDEMGLGGGRCIRHVSGRDRLRRRGRGGRCGSNRGRRSVRARCAARRGGGRAGRRRRRRRRCGYGRRASRFRRWRAWGWRRRTASDVLGCN